MAITLVYSYHHRKPIKRCFQIFENVCFFIAGLTTLISSLVFWAFYKFTNDTFIGDRVQELLKLAIVNTILGILLIVSSILYKYLLNRITANNKA